MKSFFVKNGIVKNQIKTNVWFILTFCIFLTIIASVVPLFPSSDGFNIRSNSVYIYNVVSQETGEPMGGDITFNFGMGLLSSYLFLGPTTLIICSIAAVSLVHINIGSEIKTGKISVWMTTTRTRANIFYSKLCSIWAELSIILVIPTVVTLAIAAFAKDANHYFSLILVDCLTLWIMVFLLSTIYTLICVMFVNAGRSAIVINSLIITYIFLTFIIGKISEIVPSLQNGVISVFVKSISIQSLYVQTSYFKDIPDDAYENIKNPIQYVKNYVYGESYIPEKSFGWEYIAPVINLSLIGAISFGTSSIFNNKEFMI